MTVPPLAAYPATRLRRLRQADWSRRMVRETSLQPSDLIWSMVVHEGEGRIPVASMPGVDRLSVAEAAKAAVAARELGIPCIAIFPHIDGARKDAEGSLAAEEDGVICRAIKAMKAAAPEVGIMCDVALDPFTTHGHDGVLKDGRIVNDATIERLVEQALVQARAGCDILAPSDMMDGRVGAIRAALGAPVTRRPTRWIPPTAKRPSARSPSTSPRAPTWSWSSRACPISTSPAGWSTNSPCPPSPSRSAASTR
jgi:porphobilinogen synthase